MSLTPTFQGEVQFATPGGIYAIVNLKNGKVYIGSAVSFDARWKRHKADLRKGRHHSILLQRAWQLHGENAFRFDVLEVVAERSELISVEQRHLDEHRPFDPAFGYNVSPTAGSSLGVKHGPEFSKKLSLRLQGDGHPLKGRKHSAEARAKMSSTRRANSRCVPHSEAAKEKMSAAARGRVISPEQRAKISATLKGRTKPPDQVRRSVASRAGYRHSPDVKRRIAEANRSTKWLQSRATLAWVFYGQ